MVNKTSKINPEMFKLHKSPSIGQCLASQKHAPALQSTKGIKSTQPESCKELSSCCLFNHRCCTPGQLIFWVEVRNLARKLSKAMVIMNRSKPVKQCFIDLRSDV